ncbi:hypothetical protein FISHEDRAFT_74878 [Fistulina hepatica ATCC 64428]|uniref:BTB domain-containing protein n=1 Tax=Fistulina hepatica ATCC 64428 TaxID=1128425 RepID=A0A0D7A903_9AGAR|nr:hypothetical protein FISHEDRAFT_74878 [Fistulina hepatica ATCC 64428]
MSEVGAQAESDTGSNVCPPYADLTLKSKDGVLFKVKKTDLAASSDTFPIPSDEEESEIVEMEESADVLELLLAFTTRKPHYPNLLGVSFEMRLRLAYAALKWQIPAVMVICGIRFEPEFSQEPLAIFKLALAYGDQSFIDTVAPYTLTQSATVMLENLPDDATFKKWVIYREEALNDGVMHGYGPSDFKKGPGVPWNKIKPALLSPHTSLRSSRKFSSTLKQ